MRLFRTLAAALVAFSSLSLAAQKVAQESGPSFGLTDASSGWVLASDHLFWTDSLGTSWKEITPPTSATLSSAAFTSSTTGWVAEFNGTQISVARTVDGGAHWSSTAIASPFTSAQSPNGASSLSFADAQHGFLMLGLQSGTAFRQGILLRTADGGLTWSQLPTPPAGGDIRFTDALHGFDGPGPAGDELFRTADGGLTWTRVALPVSADLATTNSRVSLPTFTSASNGSLDRTFDGNLTVHYTTEDGGLTWTASAPTTASSTPVHSAFASATNGFGLFSEGHCDTTGCTQTTALRATRDGGVSYVDVATTDGVALSTTHTMDAPSAAHPNSSSVYNTAGVMGFDACSLPTTAQMQDWITNSPYRVAGMYIGGANYANCSQSLSKLNTAWVSTVQGMGWQLIPIWVGPQGPGACSGSCSTISTTASTAQTQGATEADSAIAALTALGIGQGTPIVYDMEAYTRNTTNEALTTAFLQGWATELHAKGFLAAAYSSHPEFTDWYSLAPEYSPKNANPVDTIWFAYFFSTGVACGTTCQTVFPTQTSFDISTSYWLNNHRMRQTSSGFNSTYGSTTINIDEDWVDAAMVTPTPNTLTLTKAGTGSGTVASTTITNNNSDSTILTAINCGSSCTAKFASTDTIVLAATAATGSSFTSWTGCTTSSGTTCTVAVNAAAVGVTATFTANPGVTVSKAGTGTGTVVSADSNINCGSTCTFAYAQGTTVTLTATASTGSFFAGWSGCTTSTGATCTVTVGATTATVTPTFTLNPVLTVAKSGTGSGTITSADANINCGSTCSFSYAPGTTVVLTATAATGSSFASWTGCTTTAANVCTIVTGSTAVTVTPTFTLNPGLTVSKAGTGTGTVVSTDSNINCGATCTFAYAQGTTVTLTATASTGSFFAGWSGCTTSTGASCTVTVGASATTVTPTFTLNPVLTVAKSGTGSGTVTSADLTINCGSTCSAGYAPGTTIVLTAVPASGSVFTSWSGCTSVTVSTCSITLSAAATVTVTFSPAPAFTSTTAAPSLTVSAGTSGSDTINLVTTNGWTGTFSNFACSGQPATVTCAFSPTSVTASANTTYPVTLTVTVPSTISAVIFPGKQVMLLAGLLPFGLLPFARRRRGSRWITLALVAAAALATQGLTGCGGSGSTAAKTPTTTTVFSGTMNVTFTSTPTGGTATTNTVPIALTVTKTS